MSFDPDKGVLVAKVRRIKGLDFAVVGLVGARDPDPAPCVSVDILMVTNRDGVDITSSVNNHPDIWDALENALSEDSP